MSKAIRTFLLSLSSELHLILALFFGAILRLISSWYVYGPQALDDYRHGLLPAYQAWAGLDSTLPGYRSPLLIWIMTSILEMGEWFAIDSPVAQARLIGAVLGMVSLIAIYGAYRMTEETRNPIQTGLACYLVALHGIMPFLSTRAFGESVAAAFVIAGFGFFMGQRPRYTLGFLLLGIATLFRFQVGVMYLAVLFILLFGHGRRAFMRGIVVGLGITVAQSVIDLLAGRLPLETLYNYLMVNKDGGAAHGVGPWYTPLVAVLAITYFPFSLPLFRRTKEFLKDHMISFAPFILFIALHCVMPHKEERFMYPVAGLALVYLAFFWSENWEKPLSRWLYTPAFVLLNAVLIYAACFNNTQSSEIDPVAATEGRFESVHYLDLESVMGRSWISEYYVRPPSRMTSIKIDQLAQAESMMDGHDAILVVTSNPSYKKEIENFDLGSGYSCLPVQTAGSLSDRIVYAVNPRRNQRRRPSWFKICEKKTEV